MPALKTRAAHNCASSVVASSGVVSSGVASPTVLPIPPLRARAVSTPYSSRSNGSPVNGANADGTHGAARPRNRFLASLPQTVWNRWSPHLRHALLIQGQTLFNAETPCERIYFPNSGLISLVVNSRDGSQVEVGVIGREGTTAMLSTLSGTRPAVRGLVQIAGNACWLPRELVKADFLAESTLRDQLMQAWELLGAQATQSALCNRLHSVDERLARWLLAVRDRIGSDEIEVTHEAIAQMLGSRRSGVTVALGALQSDKLIDGTRGKITILDSARLQSNACECYQLLNDCFQILEAAQTRSMPKAQTPAPSLSLVEADELMRRSFAPPMRPVRNGF